MPEPDILDLRPKPDASSADIMARKDALSQRQAATTQRIVELHAKKKDILLTATAPEIRAVAEQIATATMELEQIEALQESVEAMLKATRDAEAIASHRAQVEKSDRLLAELDALTPSYLEAAAVVAAFAAKSEEQAMTGREAMQRLVALQTKYPGVAFPLPKTATSAYHDTIRLPAISKPGWDGNDEALNRFWPRPHVPAAAPPAPRVIGPARFYGQDAPSGSPLRIPGTPVPPIARWGLVPDYGAPDAA